MNRHLAKEIWKVPTRRAFVAMLGLGAAALATVKIKAKQPASTAVSPAVSPTRWIGHC